MNFSKSTGWYTVLILLGVIYPVTVVASTSQVRISHLVVKNTADSLLVDLKIDSDFAPQMKAAVLNGVPIRFAISISLYEVKDLWFDEKVAAQTAIHELRYDAMRKAFKVTRFRRLAQPTYIEDFDAAWLHISEISNLALIPLTDLKKGEQYQLMVGTVLSIKGYPPFALFQKFKTDRYAVNFIF